jgi:hypothetical protein
MGLLERLVNDGHDMFDMFPGRNFRNDTAKFTVYQDLCRYNTGEHFPPVPDDGCCGFITTAFNA